MWHGDYVGRGAKVFFSLAFAVLLAAPSGQQAFDIVPLRPVDENRRLATMPAFARAGLISGRFMNRFEAWYNDHVGFRDALIRLNNEIHLAVFAVSPTPRVIMGKAGWLYYAPTADDFVREYSPSTRTMVDGVCSRLIEFRDALAQRGVDFLLVVIPNKSTLYPDFMPDKFPRVAGPSLCQRLADRLRREGNVRVLLLEDALRKHMGEGLLYRQRGTHWNDVGAFYGYCAVLEELGRRYRVECVPADKVGCRVVRMDKDSARMVEGLRDRRRRIPVLTVEHTPARGRRLPPTVWCGDSFSFALESLLGPHFESFTFIHFARQPLIRSLEPRLPRTKLVVLAIAERNVRRTLPYYRLPFCAPPMRRQPAGAQEETNVDVAQARRGWDNAAGQGAGAGDRGQASSGARAWGRSERGGVR